MSADREIKQPESRTGDSSSGFTGHTHLDRAKPPAPFDERYLACGTAQPSRCPRLPLNCPHSLKLHTRSCHAPMPLSTPPLTPLPFASLPFASPPLAPLPYAHCPRRRRLRRCRTRTARVAAARIATARPTTYAFYDRANLAESSQWLAVPSCPRNEAFAFQRQR